MVDNVSRNQDERRIRYLEGESKIHFLALVHNMFSITSHFKKNVASQGMKMFRGSFQ